MISKTTVASKTSKTISAWWQASNLKQMPLVMKCHINHLGPFYLCCPDLDSNEPNNQHRSAQLRRTILEPCYDDSNRGACAVRNTKLASKTSKTITAWWLTPNLKQLPLTMKCQIKNKRTHLPLQHRKLERFGKLVPSCSFIFVLCKLST